MTPMEAVWGRKREDPRDKPEESPEGGNPSDDPLFVVACALGWVAMFLISVLLLAWLKS